MRAKLPLIILFVLLINFSIVSAEIMMSQPKSVYNLGDTLNLVVEVSEIKDGFLDVRLECGLNEAVLDHSMLASKKKEINIPLTAVYINSLKGECYISTTYGGEMRSTGNFRISDKINVFTTPDKITMNPGEKIEIKGEAIKENGQQAAGFVEASIEGTEIRTLKRVSDGKFSLNFTIPSNAEGKDYIINSWVYEKDSQGNIMNEGSSEININVKKKPTKIEIAIDRQTIGPGTNITFKPIIYDQADYEIQGEVRIEVKDAFDDIYWSKLVRTGDEATINFDTNVSAGYWKIEASSQELKTKRLFLIEEMQKARFQIINDTLIVTNVGNVQYKKSIQIAIGDEVEVKEMDLYVGESKKFRLLGPDGEYKVSVTDGSESLVLSGVGLTGNVIGIMDLRNQSGLFTRYPIVWLFLIVVFGLFILMMFERAAKKSSYGFAPKSSETARKPEKTAEVSSDWKDFKISGNVKEAEHSLVLNGRKEEASVIALKVKNWNKLGKGNALENLEKAVESIGKHKGTVYKTGGEIMGIFTPSVTKTFKNDPIAIKVASEIASHLNEHNKKFKDKIEFGIGVNSGEIVASVGKDKLKFTAIGNALSTAKKIADSAEDSVLISEATNKKVMSEVKTEKKGDYYSIKKIVDREQYKEFLDGFMKRN